MKITTISVIISKVCSQQISGLASGDLVVPLPFAPLFTFSPQAFRYVFRGSAVGFWMNGECRAHEPKHPPTRHKKFPNTDVMGTPLMVGGVMTTHAWRHCRAAPPPFQLWLSQIEESLFCSNLRRSGQEQVQCWMAIRSVSSPTSQVSKKLDSLKLSWPLGVLVS